MDVAWWWVISGSLLAGWGAAAARRDPDPQPWFCVLLDVALAGFDLAGGVGVRQAGALRMLVGTLAAAGGAVWLWLGR